MTNESTMLENVKYFFNLDPIALIMLALTAFIGISVASYSVRYLKGDQRYGKFFGYLALLLTSLFILASADHIALFFAGWCLSNLFLVRLMIHKASWSAAKYSGKLALSNYALGALCVGSALFLLYLITGQTSIFAISQCHLSSQASTLILTLLLLGAMTQSAIFPFHKWLLSSLNSPTPVSALMHAGLVNGGGFLLLRFAPLYFQHNHLLTFVFVLGIITALMGTFWKLLQNDVKRMLACSTMGQMGFMLAQCGLGLFPAALAHLVTHGMFKAYLFLASGSIVQEKRQKIVMRPTFFNILISLACGVLGSILFSFVTGKNLFSYDTTFVLIMIAFITATQAAITILSQNVRYKFTAAFVITALMSLLYGTSISLIQRWVEPMHLMQPEPLNAVHVVAMIALALSWIGIVLFRSQAIKQQKWMMILYVKALNAAQPHKKSVTTYRNQYTYL